MKVNDNGSSKMSIERWPDIRREKADNDRKQSYYAHQQVKGILFLLDSDVH